MNPSPTGEPFRSVGVRQLSSATPVTITGAQRLLGHRPGDPRLRRHLSVDVRLERHAAASSTARPAVHVTPAFDLAGGVRVEHEHGTSGATSETDAHQLPARLSKRAGTVARIPLRQRRPRASTTTTIFGNACDAARLGGGVPAPSPRRRRRVRRHEAHLQRRQGHQGTEPRPGTVVAVRAGAAGDGASARGSSRSDRSGAAASTSASSRALAGGRGRRSRSRTSTTSSTTSSSSSARACCRSSACRPTRPRRRASAPT